MMQKDLLFPWRTLLGNVLLGLETRGVDRTTAEDRAREYLKSFGLAGFENAYPKTLSGGMRQRVALIRTLIMDPDILLLDEPFSALDYQTRLYLEGVLKEAVETYHKTVILVTHDIDEAVALSKRVGAERAPRAGEDRARHRAIRRLPDRGPQRWPVLRLFPHAVRRA
jgi:NitT/TauT family transport system ATP-binding protein